MTEDMPEARRRADSAWKAYLAYTFSAAVFLYPFMRTLFIGSDEGTFLVGAERILRGQVFARDFFEVMGPGTFYWMAAFFKLFGDNFLAARLCLFVSMMGTCLTLYYLSRQVCERYRLLPCLMLAGPYFGFLGQVESHHVDSNLFALLSITCVVLWERSRKTSLIVIAGALAGVTACFLQPKGVLLAGAILAWLVWLHRGCVAVPIRAAALAAAGFCAAISVELIYFWSQGALANLIDANFVFPSTHYGAVNSVRYAQGIDVAWGFWVTRPDAMQWPAGVAAVMVIPALFIAALPAILLALGFCYRWKAVQPVVVLYWLCGCALWFSEFHRRDIHHLAYGSPLLVILCFHMLSQLAGRWARAVVTALAVCAAGLAILNWFVAFSIPTVQTRAGSAALIGPDAAQTIRFLDAHVNPGEDVLIYPYSPAYYFFSKTLDPTPFSFMLHNYNTPEQYREVADILEQRRVRYVVWDAQLESKLLDELPAAVRPKSIGPWIVEPYLKSHYETVTQYGSAQILQRIPEAK